MSTNLLSRAKASAAIRDLEKALEELGQKHGLRFTTGSARYSTTELRVQLVADLVPSEIGSITPETIFGVGTTFRWRSSVFMVFDYRPPKSPLDSPWWVARSPRGKHYCFSQANIRKNLITFMPHENPGIFEDEET